MRFVIDPPIRTSASRPGVRAGVRRAHNAYIVPGVGTVEAWPHRPLGHARAIARRLFVNPADYAAVIRQCAVPGVTLEPQPRPAIRAA
jgi:hypothetical protein